MLGFSRECERTVVRRAADANVTARSTAIRGHVASLRPGAIQPILSAR
jgi:hypothetical protein